MKKSNAKIVQAAKETFVPLPKPPRGSISPEVFREMFNERMNALKEWHSRVVSKTGCSIAEAERVCAEAGRELEPQLTRSKK